MKGGVDGLMPDSTQPTAGKLRRINPPRELADKPRYSGFREWLNGNRGKVAEKKIVCQDKQ
jgi:hypothetical protein